MPITYIYIYTISRTYTSVSLQEVVPGAYILYFIPMKQKSLKLQFMCYNIEALIILFLIVYLFHYDNKNKKIHNSGWIKTL